MDGALIQSSTTSHQAPSQKTKNSVSQPALWKESFRSTPYRVAHFATDEHSPNSLYTATPPDPIPHLLSLTKCTQTPPQGGRQPSFIIPPSKLPNGGIPPARYAPTPTPTHVAKTKAPNAASYSTSLDTTYRYDTTPPYRSWMAASGTIQGAASCSRCQPPSAINPHAQSSPYSRSTPRTRDTAAIARVSGPRTAPNAAAAAANCAGDNTRAGVSIALRRWCRARTPGGIRTSLSTRPVRKRASRNASSRP